MLNSPRTLSAKSSAIPELLGQPALIPVSLSGTEGINTLFDYKLILKTPDALNHLSDKAANFNLDDFIGRELTVAIALEGDGTFVSGAVGGGLGNVGAGTREISGLITAARLLREEGRYVFYEVTLRPWLHLATLRSNCKIFQDQTVVELLDSLLAGYSFPVDKRLIESYPTRDYQTQYNETDYAFFCRLCEEWGINYFFEHSDGKHRLVLIDSTGAHKKFTSSAYHVLDFYTEGKRIDEETIHAFVPAHNLTSGQYTTRDYDYTRPKAELTATRSDPRSTAQNKQEVYQWHADAHYSQPRAGAGGAATQNANDPQAEGDFIARLRMQALRSPGHRAQGSGHIRGMVPGCTFILKRHPMEAANTEYLILSTTFTIEEIAQETQRVGSLRSQQYRIQVDFAAQPTREGFRPERNTPKPFTHGPTTAKVVGPEGQNIWTDELGRIKVQFPWDRLGQNDQNSSCWVRVAAPWAGNQLGGMHLPRIGQEVIIDFIGGDPDLPLCTGRVYNQMNLPPWALPSQSALSGFRSRELNKEGGNAAGGRSNHLVMDDTEGKIQSQLKSDHQHSQLSLGHITRIEDNAGRKDPRGEGFELRTDGHGAIRAKDGLLITTEARVKAQRHITDMGGSVQQLTHARDQHESLADLSQQHQAQEHVGGQSDVVKVLKAQNDAIKGSGGNREDGSFPELTEPHLILASPAGIETTTSKTTHIASGDHIALTSGQHLSLSVGRRLLASVKNGIRLFSHKAGMKLIAACGDIDIQALKDSVNLLAKLSITHTANRISITAKEEVVINGGGSYTKFTAGGIEHGTNGSYVAHAAMHNFSGPRSVPVKLPSLPFKLESGSFSNRLDVYDLFLYHDFGQVGYKALSSGTVITGNLDEHGRTEQIYSKQTEKTKVMVGAKQDEWDSETEILDASSDQSRTHYQNKTYAVNENGKGGQTW
ncbi:type VI secretion system Vgr family protein [Collimonas silvisoli]|uniref:type VI secretion system Vgr family protein n=1 Tax=Collimonas silvisoli TaxID=2825884 RepID=UPI001B8B060C|nr:type VI secretion system Vgr family protein [Collimonas silvisoli]